MRLSINAKLFPVVAVICCMALAVYSCTKGKINKNKTARTLLDTTYNIAGARLMHGFENRGEVRGYDSIVHLNDSSMVFRVINDSTINIGGVQFLYIADLSNDSLLYYWSVNRDSLFSEASVSYYFRKDRIVVDRLIFVTASGYVETVYYTPK